MSYQLICDKCEKVIDTQDEYAVVAVTYTKVVDDVPTVTKEQVTAHFHPPHVPKQLTDILEPPPPDPPVEPPVEPPLTPEHLPA
jgi:hypothetical protein